MAKPKHEILARKLGEHEFRFHRLTPEELLVIQQEYLEDFRASLIPKPKVNKKVQDLENKKQEILNMIKEFTEMEK